MKDEANKSVAESLEASGQLLPLLPYLLQDLWALGSSVDDIINVISDLNLPAETTRILDLGCGKGAVIVKLAQKFGFSALGIDGMKPFLENEIQSYIEHQKIECDIIDEKIEGALWLLQRKDRK